MSRHTFEDHHGGCVASTERGGVTSEVLVLTPALVLLMLFVVFAGRLGQADQDLTQAAAEAARAASLDRGGDAVAVARRTVANNLAASGVECRALDVAVDGAPPRAGATIAVTARCDVDMTAVAGLGLPRGSVVRASAVEVVDTYRGDG